MVIGLFESFFLALKSRFLKKLNFIFICGALFVPGEVCAQSILREFWDGISNGNITTLKDDPRYPEAPSGTELLNLFEVPPNKGDNYGSRVSGYIVPPQTGDYTFWISADNFGELWLSKDGLPESKEKIASVPLWTNFRQWNRSRSQKSEPIYLEVGKPYYIEAIQVEQTGGDHLSVGWDLPDGTSMRPIEGEYLRSNTDQFSPPEIVQQPTNVRAEENQNFSLRVAATGSAPLRYQWFFNGNPLEDFKEAKISFFEARPEWNEAEVYCRITNAFGEVETTKVTIQIDSETVSPALASKNPSEDSVVTSLEFIEVVFSEPVDGVDAADLLVDGVPAIEVEGEFAGPYRFYLDPLETGLHKITLSSDSEIFDRAIIPNAFSGEEWNVELAAAIEPDSVIISEILAVNPDGETDENGQSQDWIELWNKGDEAINLNGWSISDERQYPGKWVFPDVTIGANARLVLFASGLDRKGDTLHTNFKLGIRGEYLALYGPGAPRPLISWINQDGEFPEQRVDYSFGLARDGNQWGYFSRPTPGSRNSSTITTEVSPEPHFSVDRGYYKDPFSLVLSAGRLPESGTRIRYTTDGSMPTTRRGRIYRSPIRINSTTTVRAIVTKDDALPSKVVTHTYVKETIRSYLDIPVISITTDRNNLWGTTGIMETNPRNTTKRGIAWERPCSVEWIFPDGENAFQVDCGLRVQGGNYVRSRYNPNDGGRFGKYSFRLYFRSDYGPGKLRHKLFPDTQVDEFDVVSLRAGMNDYLNPFVVDELTRRLHSDMGHVASHGTFAHLFINGKYEGYYNPTERIDDNFLNSYSSTEEDWDIIAQFNETREGDRREWNRLLSAARKDLSSLDNFIDLSKRLNIDSFIDYLILNIYAGTGDWPHNNWRAARPRKNGALWEFLVWDAEWAFGNQNRSVNSNTITSELARDSEITSLFQALRRSEEFRIRFSDRVQKHLYGDGVLTRNHVRNRYLDMFQIMSPVINNMLTTVSSQWVTARPRVIENHLKNAGLYDPGKAPKSSKPNGIINRGETIQLSTRVTSDIYFTMDGSDPRVSPLDETKALELVAEKDNKRVLVPNEDFNPSNWKGGSEPYDDDGWISGIGGIGFDSQTTYDPYIQTDLEEQMRNKYSGFYVRIPFEYDPFESDGFERLVLEARYEDGFIAFINGVEVYSVGMEEQPAWDSDATVSHSDSRAQNLTPFDISQFKSLLVPGTNILAAHVANKSKTNSDLLFSPRLILTKGFVEPGGVSPTATLYSSPITLSETTIIKARAREGDKWSPLSEFQYDVVDNLYSVRISEIMYHPAVESDPEWIEITNFGNQEIDIGQWSIQGAGFTFGHGIKLSPGQSVVIVESGKNEIFQNKYPIIDVGGEFEGSLSNRGETLRLIDKNGNLVDEINYNDRGAWPEQADGAGASLELTSPSAPPSSASWWYSSNVTGGSPGSFRPALNLGSITINEIVPFPATDNSGEDSQPADWVELLNDSDETIALSGWRLSDDATKNDKWIFPQGTELPPGEFLIVGLGSIPRGLNTQLVAPFSLDRDGESLYLFNSSGLREDGIEFGFMPEGYSLSRFGSKFLLGLPTPNDQNQLVEPGSPLDLRFNEWLLFPSDGSKPWLEITQVDSPTPIELSGLIFRGDDWAHQIRRPTFLGNNEFLVFEFEQEFGRGELPSPPLQKSDRIYLETVKGEKIDDFRVASNRVDYSYGYLPDGSNSRKSFGSKSTRGYSNALANKQGLQFSEYMAWQTDLSDLPFNSWLEISNSGEEEQPLRGYKIVDSYNQFEWSFPDNSSIQPGGYLVLGMDLNQPIGELNTGHLNSGLMMSHEGGHFLLVDSRGDLADSILFGSQIIGISVQPGQTYKLLEQPTPGLENSDTLDVSSTQLLINEWRATHPHQSDWVEIFNESDKPADLTRISISDNPYVYENAFVSFPQGSFVAANGWARFYTDRSRNRTPWSLDFQIDGDGELLRLYSSSEKLIDEVVVSPTPDEIVFGRYPDGDDNIRELLATPGFSNTFSINNNDTDQDGIPDFWENEFDLNPWNPNDALFDFDDDGITNLEEFTDNSNPYIENERLIIRIQYSDQANGAIVVRFDSPPGFVYALEQSKEISGPDAIWTEHGRKESGDDGGEIFFLYSPNAESHFFRIRRIQ